MFSILLTLLSVSKDAPRASWVCSMFGRLRKKGREHCSVIVLQIMQAPHRCQQLRVMTPFWNNHERHQQREIVAVSRTSACTYLYILLGGEMVKCAVVYWFLGSTHGLADCSGTCKQQDGKIVEEDICWRCMGINLFEWVKDVKMHVSHVNIHQKVT